MKGVLFSKQSKIVVDILLVIGLILLIRAGHIGTASGSYWTSLHCVIGSLLSLFIILHVTQHWRLIKAFTNKKVILKNKLTALAIICLALMLLSIISFIAVGISLPRFHNVIGHFFILIMVIHVIDKSKRFISLF